MSKCIGKHQTGEVHKLKQKLGRLRPLSLLISYSRINDGGID